MQMEHPAPFQYVPISHQVQVRLNCAAMFGKMESWQVVEEAIDEWARKYAPGALNEPGYGGYQWKTLFLPEGTVLRTTYRGAHHYCRVEGGRIIHKEAECSPSGFVNAVGGIRRNAWKSLWLLLPDCKHWQLADTLRVHRRAPSRKTRQAAAAPQGPATPPEQGTAAAAPAPNVPSSGDRRMPPSTPLRTERRKQPPPLGDRRNPRTSAVPASPRRPDASPVRVAGIANGERAGPQLQRAQTFAVPLTGHLRWTTRPDYHQRRPSSTPSFGYSI